LDVAIPKADKVRPQFRVRREVSLELNLSTKYLKSLAVPKVPITSAVEVKMA
jgi:hypothetical protein